MKKAIFYLQLAFLFRAQWPLARTTHSVFWRTRDQMKLKAAIPGKPLRRGSSLNANDELKVSENSYLALVHKTGKPMELKKAGSYKVSDLAAKVGGGTSVLNQYVDFVLSSNSAEAKKNRMSATGGRSPRRTRSHQPVVATE